MITWSPIEHEKEHVRLLNTPILSATRPTSGSRIGERRLHPGTGIEWFWNGNAWQQIGAVQPNTWANRPTSPTSGQLFFAQDRACWYYWSTAVSRWLTTEVFEIQVFPTGTYAMPGSITVNTPYGFGSFHGGPINLLSTDNSFVFVGAEVTCATAATYNSTHYWQPNIYITSATGGTSEIFGIIAWDATHTTAGQIYHFTASGVPSNTVYNTTTAAVVSFIYRNNVAPSVGGVGACSVYKQSVLIRIAG